MVTRVGGLDVIVVGGGLAGMACAVALTDAGRRVGVLETRRRLGGRATSFVDPRTGEEVDNCQHVVLGCCTNYRWLAERLGVSRLVEWWDRQWWYEPGGRVSEVGAAGWLPAPGHLAPGLARARFLSAAEKMSLACAMAGALRADRERWRGVPFSAWLDDAGQSERLVDRFWTPLIVSACNARVTDVSAASALHVVQEGVLAEKSSFRMGVPKVPLARLYDPALGIIESGGGWVRCGAGVEHVDGRGATLRDGSCVAATRVVLAVPFERAAGMLPEDDERAAVMSRLTHSPIVGVHLAFDRPVLSSPHGVLLGDSTPWVFRKDTAGQRVHAVVSAADDWVDASEEAIVGRVLRVMRDCLGAGMAGAELEHARSVKERRATFVPSVEAGRARVKNEGDVVLAGCYTDTGWPSTMEGAVRSGLRAAEVILDEAPGTRVRGPLMPGVVPRVLGGAGMAAQVMAAR